MSKRNPYKDIFYLSNFQYFLDLLLMILWWLEILLYGLKFCLSWDYLRQATYVTCSCVTGKNCISDYYSIQTYSSSPQKQCFYNCTFMLPQNHYFIQNNTQLWHKTNEKIRCYGNNLFPLRLNFVNWGREFNEKTVHIHMVDDTYFGRAMYIDINIGVQKLPNVLSEFYV